MPPTPRADRARPRRQTSAPARTARVRAGVAALAVVALPALGLAAVRVEGVLGGAVEGRAATEATSPPPELPGAPGRAEPEVTEVEVPTGDGGVATVSRYQVRSGDTLSRVAVLHAVPEDALAAHNDLGPPFELRPGDRLAIPVPEADQPPPPDPGAAEAPAVETSIARWAEANDLPPSLLAAMTWHESRWERGAQSEKGAIGVGQVLPTTATWVADELIGQPLDPWAIDDNVRLSARYLRWLVDRADGDHAAALAAYYQGEASLAEIGWYDDTDDYVAAVFDLRWRFRDGKT